MKALTCPELSLNVPDMAYTKLFASIVTSTIWTEDDRTRIVWITMLAIADKNGEVQASVPGLARIAGVPVEDCRAAIGKFLSPDPDSRTKDDEGRRIEEIDGGWSLLNFRKYREMASKEDVQASEAARKARYRAKLQRNVPKCPGDVPGVSTVNADIAEADAEAKNTEPLQLVDRSAKSSPASVSDEEWVQSLSEDPAYFGIDVHREYGKCRRWCEVNRKKLTQKRFTNWLNRVDLPMDTTQPSAPRKSNAQLSPNATDALNGFGEQPDDLPGRPAIAQKVVATASGDQKVPVPPDFFSKLASEVRNGG